MRSDARYGWIWLIVAFTAAGGLAVAAWRKAELEAQVRRASWLEVVRQSAKAHAAQLERFAREAAARAEASPVVGYARDGRFIGYEPGDGGEGDLSTSPGELGYYALSLRGGESYEALGDPARATDAYSFFLPRITSPVLRQRLRLSAARAMEQAGSTQLARALREEVFETGAGATTESGLPIDLVAALHLASGPLKGSQELLQKVRSRIEAGLQRIPTPLLDRLVQALGDESGRLREAAEARRTLERAVEACPRILDSRDAAAAGDVLAIAKVEPSGARSLRAARWEPASALALIEGERFEATWSPEPPRAADHGVPAEPITLEDGGPPLGHVAAVGGTALDGLRRASGAGAGLERAFLVSQVVMILLCCVNLLLLLRRERQLARLRDRLLANVSHELKTPVTSVRMFAELLGQAGLDPAEAALLRGHLRRESARLSQLVENLLDLSRPARIEAQLAREPVDVRSLLRDVAEGFAYRAREIGVELSTAGLDAGAVVLETNGPAVERIVLNLLDNALKYRRPEKARIQLSLECANGTVRASVEDNGPGIPAQDRERVFEELYRGKFEDYGVQGMGLGLSIARRLARKLGGDVTLSSRPGVGSTFTLELPAAAAGTKGAAA